MKVTNMIESNLAMKHFRNMHFTARAGTRWFAAMPGVLLCMLTLLAGCQKQDAIIAGIDIPIPSQMTKVADKPFDPIPGYDDGQAAFEGKMNNPEIFNFYQENMEARGWKPTSFMSTGKDQLAYQKNDKICLVWYTPLADGKTSLVILIGTTKVPQ